MCRTYEKRWTGFLSAEFIVGSIAASHYTGSAVPENTSNLCTTVYSKSKKRITFTGDTLEP